MPAEHSAESTTSCCYICLRIFSAKGMQNAAGKADAGTGSYWGHSSQHGQIACYKCSDIQHTQTKQFHLFNKKY